MSNAKQSKQKNDRASEDRESAFVHPADRGMTQSGLEGAWPKGGTVEF